MRDKSNQEGGDEKGGAVSAVTTTKDIIEAVRAVQRTVRHETGEGPYTVTGIHYCAVLDADEGVAAEGLAPLEAHALAHLLNLDLDGVTE